MDEVKLSQFTINITLENYMRYSKSLELRNIAKLIELYKKAYAKDGCWIEITLGIRDIGILDMEIYLLGTKPFMIMNTVPDFDHD